MWILKFLPDWFFYATLFCGIVTLAASKFIPVYYRSIIQLISLLLVVFGVFMSGAISNEASWIARVKELEVKIANAEVQSVKETVKVVQKVVTKTQVIKERGEDVIKYVDREVVKYDNSCIIPKEFVKALNEAAEVKK